MTQHIIATLFMLAVTGLLVSGVLAWATALSKTWKKASPVLRRPFSRTAA